jgi:nucleoid-associated protein YgaU
MPNMKDFTSKVITNDSEFYKELIERRGVKKVEHYTTPRMRHPSIAERTATKTTTHIWKYGDRFSNLSHQYYGDVRYWWVIAWYNGVPTEAEVSTGDVMEIPIDIQQALLVLGA